MATLQFPTGMSQLLLSMGIAGLEPKWNFSVSPGKVSLNLTWVHVNTGTIAPGPPPGMAPVQQPIKRNYFSSIGTNIARHLPPRLNKRNHYHDRISRSEQDLQWRESSPPDNKSNHTISHSPDSDGTCSPPNTMPVSHSLDSDSTMHHIDAISHSIECDNINCVTESDNDSAVTVMKSLSTCVSLSRSTDVSDTHEFENTDNLQVTDDPTVINVCTHDIIPDNLLANALNDSDNLSDDNETVHSSGSESMSSEESFDREFMASPSELSDNDYSHAMYTTPDILDIGKSVSPNNSVIEVNICDNVSEEATGTSDIFDNDFTELFDSGRFGENYGKTGPRS